MHLETTRLLRALRNLKTSSHYMPFVTTFSWNTDDEGDFNFWNLLVSKGRVRPARVEEAIASWKNTERRGTPTKQVSFGYAPRRRKRRDSSWSPYLQAQQFKYYNALAYFLKTRLQNLEIYALIGHGAKLFHGLFAETYEIYLILGQTPALDWICLAPTVPDQIWERYSSSHHPDVVSLTACKSKQGVTQDLHCKTKEILSRLKPIEIYGFYDGGYNYSYNHQIFCSASPHKFEAIELALKSGKVLEDDPYYFHKEILGVNLENNDLQDLLGISLEDKTLDEIALEVITRDNALDFIRTNFQEHKKYMLCLWTLGYAYYLGRTSLGDWIGLEFSGEFEYNP